MSGAQPFAAQGCIPAAHTRPPLNASQTQNCTEIASVCVDRRIDVCHPTSLRICAHSSLILPGTCLPALPAAQDTELARSHHQRCGGIGNAIGCANPKRDPRLLQGCRGQGHRQPRQLLLAPADSMRAWHSIDAGAVAVGMQVSHSHWCPRAGGSLLVCQCTWCSTSGRNPQPHV